MGRWFYSLLALVLFLFRSFVSSVLNQVHQRGAFGCESYRKVLNLFHCLVRNRVENADWVKSINLMCKDVELVCHINVCCVFRLNDCLPRSVHLLENQVCNCESTNVGFGWLKLNKGHPVNVTVQRRGRTKLSVQAWSMKKVHMELPGPGQPCSSCFSRIWDVSSTDQFVHLCCLQSP